MSKLIQLHQPNIPAIYERYCQQGYKSAADWGMTEADLRSIVMYCQEQLTMAKVPGVDELLAVSRSLLDMSLEHVASTKADTAELLATGKDYRDSIQLAQKMLDSHWQKVREAGKGLDNSNAFEVTVRKV